MLRIGEFSRLAQISIRMLRHYDAIGILRPAGIDDQTGYRYYSIDQLSRLNRILALRDLGLSLGQITRLLADDLPVAEFHGMLAIRRADLERQLKEGRLWLARVEARLRQIETEGKPSPYDVVVKDVPAQPIASTRAIVPDVSAMAMYRCALYDELYEGLARNGIEPALPEYAFYHDVEYLDRDIDTETAVAISAIPGTPLRIGADRLTLRELPATPAMATVVHSGSAYDIPLAISALYTWVGANGLATSGPFREVHLFGRENDHVDRNPENLGAFVVELQVPLADSAANIRRLDVPLPA
ncbi:MAG TPA: MerR family transcriptional regulator [Thermomicrobiales bacterium]|nr:MerR family transcriptional regulator [Thermomicrobiales bacterium]